MSELKICDSNEISGLLRKFLNTTLKEIMLLINADCGSLFLFDSQANQLVLDSSYNSCDLRLQGVRHMVGEGVSGKMANIKMPVLVKDIDTDARFKGNLFKHTA